MFLLRTVVFSNAKYMNVEKDTITSIKTLLISLNRTVARLIVNLLTVVLGQDMLRMQIMLFLTMLLWIIVVYHNAQFSIVVWDII